MHRERIASIIVFVAIVGQHFELFSAGGYPVTLGLILGIPLILGRTRRVPYVLVSLVASFVIVVAAFGALTAQDSYSGLDDFVRTLALFVLALVVLCCALSGLDRAMILSPEFGKSIFAALATVVGLSVAQVALGFLGSEVLFNPFGPFQYLHAYEPYLQFNPVPRAQGFFLEPSYDAFVVGTLTVILLALKVRVRWTLCLALAGLLAARSATGLVLILLVGVVFALRSRPAAAVSIAVGSIVVLLVAGDYLDARFSSFGDQGSSSNYRLVAPLIVLRDTLSTRPLGNPLGSVSDVLSTYGLRNGAAIGTSLDNGLYVIVFYFGFVGVIALFLAAIGVLVSVFGRRANGFGAVVPLWLFGTLFFSGGVMLPEYALMVGLALATWRVAVSNVGDKNAESESASVDHRRDLPGRGRRTTNAGLSSRIEARSTGGNRGDRR
jgi:putative colanic acid polymerase